MVIPVYNEEGNLVKLYRSIKNTFSELYTYDYNILFVDDGSTDQSLLFIMHLAEEDPAIQYISLSKNFGHQYALKAGLDFADGDCVISMDADLQHPAMLVPEMLNKWEEGFDIVYTLRKEDHSMPFIKRTASRLFYKVLNRLSDIEIEAGTADFRLLSAPVVAVLKNLEESDLFFRGLVKWIGFNQYAIPYKPGKRNSGKTKYNFIKMSSLALRGITSFSNKPLYVAAYLGFLFSGLSLLYLPYALISYFMGHTISGWTSIIVSISFFGGLQLSILGIIGIYIGKLFKEAKKRPKYIIRASNIVCRETVKNLSY